MTGIALLGAGFMARTHAAVYSALADRAQVRVVCAKSGAGEIASEFGAVATDDWEAAITTPGVDAVDICLPTPVHARFAIAALVRGKHVFCETPMALVLDEALAMQEVAHKAGRLLQVGLLCRSIATYVHVKQVSEAGTHGRLLGLATWRLGSYLHPGAPDRKAHYSDPTTELMTFDLDFAGWLMGRPARLSAAGKGEVTALLDWGDGRSASIAASGLMPVGTPFSAGFRALFEGACFELQQVFRAGPPEITFTLSHDKSGPQPVALRGGNPYEIELRHFVDCIAGKADPTLLDADRAIEALRLSLATQQALAQGASVTL